MSSGSTVSVAIVGGGPVGLTLAALLGSQGHRVAVLEQHSRAFDRPRAIHFDHEIMRVLARLGIATELLPTLVSIDRYEWYGADGQPILQIPTPPASVSGWGSAYFFYQPDLDTALRRRVEAEPTVTVHTGWQVTGLRQDDDGVELAVRRTDEDASPRRPRSGP